LMSRMRGLLRIEKLERDLDEELRSHVEMRTLDNVADGRSPEEARYEARRQFGNMTPMKEDAREMDIVKWMETAGQNLRYAVRMLRRSPGFTLVAILTLALGMGANVATFTVVHAVLQNPLPFAHPEHFGAMTMDAIVAKYLEQRRFALELLGVFAGVALLLASIGIYGVMAYTFSQRTNEIGIRMAMGAQRGDILKIAVGEGALIVVFGLGAGLVGSLVLTRFLQTMLFSVKPTDPLTFAGISALLGAVALAACFVPARRATRVDPLVALRHE